MKHLEFRFKKYQKRNTGLKRPVSTKKTLFMGKSLLAIGLPVLSFGVASGQCMGPVSSGNIISLGAGNHVDFDVRQDAQYVDNVQIFRPGVALAIRGIQTSQPIQFYTIGGGSIKTFATTASITGATVGSAASIGFGGVGAISVGETKHFGFEISPNQSKGFITLEVVEYTNDGKYRIIIHQRGTDIDGGVTKPDCSFLPVELTSFTAKAGQESIQLAWLTASEENNAGFEVQRSTDGRNFRTLTFIEGHGTTLEAQKYLFDDKDLRKGQLYYYRLKQIDYDGRFEHSDVVSAQLEEDSKISVLAPNPTHTGQTHLEYTSDTNGELTLQVFDVTGKELFQHVHRVSEGTNRFELDLSTLGKGLYFVKLNQGNWSGYEKVVVE